MNKSAPLSTPATFWNQVTLCCFFLDPQVICVQMPQCAQSLTGHNGESAHVCVKSLYIEMSPIVSADAPTKPHIAAAAALRATAACVLHYILMRCDPAAVYPLVMLRRVLLQHHSNLCLSTFQVDTAFLEICTTIEPWVCSANTPELTTFSQPIVVGVAM